MLIFPSPPPPLKATGEEAVPGVHIKVAGSSLFGVKYNVFPPKIIHAYMYV